MRSPLAVSQTALDVLEQQTVNGVISARNLQPKVPVFAGHPTGADRLMVL
jgi:hypothetical protein